MVNKKPPAKEKPNNTANGELIEAAKSLDVIDNPKKLLFIKTYRELHGHISDSCRAVGIVRQTYYNWLEKDTDFAICIANEDSELNDEMRAAIIHKAQDGDTTSLIFWLKYRHPDFRIERTTGFRSEDPEGNKIEVVIKDYE